MIKLFFSALLFAAVIFQNAFSQSPADLQRQYNLYKSNKVKTETIQFNDGSKTVNTYDKLGRKTEEIYYFDGKESNVTSFKYDSKGLLSEEKYFGYESGDGYSTKFYYDASGNMIKSSSAGSLEDISEFTNDEQGNPVKISYFSPTDSKAPMDFIEYKNTYENGLLTSIECTCKPEDETTFGSRYTYSGENMTLYEEYNKDCKTGKITVSAKKTYEYFDNGLIKTTIYTDSNFNETKTATYSYDNY